VTKHFLDALTLAQVVVPEGRLIDVGTGAGLPGLPLAIAHPTVQVTLLDSLQKRIRFLEHVVGELGLTNIQCIVGRAEEIGQDPEHRAQYDIVIARAVAQLSVLSEYCLPFAQVGGVVVAMKGTDVADEINQATAALKVLGGVIEQDMVVTLPRTTITHRLIVIRKIAPTPDRYPRRPGKARKAPLG
jgi:16S rRNA (guanine527-N7)-methyltransferase